MTIRVIHGDAIEMLATLADASVQCVVLDPFAGAGTTLLVADRLRRDAIGIDLSAEYAEMARHRVTNDAPLFAELT